MPKTKAFSKTKGGAGADDFKKKRVKLGKRVAKPTATDTKCVDFAKYHCMTPSLVPNTSIKMANARTISPIITFKFIPQTPCKMLHFKTLTPNSASQVQGSQNSHGSEHGAGQRWSKPQSPAKFNHTLPPNSLASLSTRRHRHLPQHRPG